MAILPDVDRQRILVGAQNHWSRLWEACNFSASELRDAVNATDDWIEANQSAYNLNLPVPFRNNATTAQKTLLFCVVAVARVSIAFLKQMVGEVD